MAANYIERQLALSVYQEALVVVHGGYGFGPDVFIVKFLVISMFVSSSFSNS